jgi:uncharacterized protein
MRTPAFHTGERALQARAGSLERLAEVGSRVIRSTMPDQHRIFFAQLPFIVTGSVDGAGQPWASVLAGPPGFLSAPAADRLQISARPGAGDPLGEALVAGAPVGLLGIEPHTRRRNRANGRIATTDDQGFAVQVMQSFGNCPKYIRARQAEFMADWPAPEGIRRAPGLDDADRRLIAAADTFFIASAHPAAADDADPAHGVDVSHRGGQPGFVRVDGYTLTIPDLAGNAYFNTLGNLQVNARAGLLFIDFASGDLLWLAAATEIIHDGAELATFAGAQRLLRLRVREVRRQAAALPLRWHSGDAAPAREFESKTRSA